MLRGEGLAVAVVHYCAAMTTPGYGSPDDAGLIVSAVEDVIATGGAGRPSLLTMARDVAGNVGELVVTVGGVALDVVSALDALAPVVEVVGQAAGAIGDAAGAIGEVAGTVGSVVGDVISSIDL